MNFIKISNDFLLNYGDYRNDVNNFIYYLSEEMKIDLNSESNWVTFQGIDVKFLLNSLKYNVEVRKVYKSKNSAKKYSTAIAQLFNYIRTETDIENPNLFASISYNRSRENTYMKKMMQYIEESDYLEGNIEQDALTRNQAYDLLNWSDEQLKDEILWDKDGEFRKAMAALGIKFMLIYGITYRELRKIRWNQYDKKRNYIKINNYDLRLPVGLAEQMKRIEEYIKCKNNNLPEFIFVDVKYQQWGETTSSSGIPDYLYMIINLTSVTSIIKYGISQMIQTGLSDSVIKKLTGASDKIIRNCVKEDDKTSRMINSKLVNVELYYDF